VAAKPIIAIVIMIKVDSENDRLNVEKISTKRKIKMKPKNILKLVFTRKSKEPKGSAFLLKA
jgi:hypothetical protein